MVRKARLSLAGELHLVMQRVWPERVPLFRNDWAYETYLNILSAQLAAMQIEANAYALLSDRIYLLLRPAHSDDISKLLQSHSRQFVPLMNRQFGWRGGLWLDRFSSALVDPQWTLKVMRFIDLWPVHAGLVGAAGVYRWSSYAHHIAHHSVMFLQSPKAYWVLGKTLDERAQAYQQWCQKTVSRVDTRHIEQIILHNGVLGEEPYLRFVEQECGYSLQPRPRGRPPKAKIAG